MDGLEFRKHGRDMVDYIVDYLDNIDSRRVTPNTEPGYLQNLIPSEPPNEPEEWDTIMDDVEKKIMIGVKFIYSEKARIFCEISTADLSYVLPVKSTVEISQNFVALSEYMIFIRKMPLLCTG